MRSFLIQPDRPKTFHQPRFQILSQIENSLSLLSAQNCKFVIYKIIKGFGEGMLTRIKFAKIILFM